MDELSSANPLEMVIPVFDGEIDAYWWVLCTEKYFKHWRTPETLKMTVAGLAMKGPPLTWWLRWYPHHRWVNWDAFTTIFLWQFKPEWRVILPSLDDEENSISESSPYFDSLVTNLSVIADDVDKSTTVNVQRNEEIPRAGEFMVQSESKFMVNTIDDCSREIVESSLNEALPVTKIFSPSKDLIATHSFPNEDSAISDAEHSDAINDNAVRNQGLSLHYEIPPALHFMSIGKNQASSLEPKFGLHRGNLLAEITVLPLTPSIQTCLSYVRQNVSTLSPPPKPPDCAVSNPLLPLKPPNMNHLMSPLPPKPPDYNFPLKQGKFQVTWESSVPPPPHEPPGKYHIMVVLQEFVTLMFPKLSGLRSLYRNRYSVTDLISESLSILSQLVVLAVYDNNLYTMVSIFLSTVKLLSDASYALTCSVDLKGTTQTMPSLSRKVTMSPLLKPCDDMFAALVTLATNMSSPAKTIMTSIFVILPPNFISLFDSGGTHLVTTLLLKLKEEVVMHLVLLRCFYNIPVKIISAEIPPPKPPDYATILLPLLVCPLIDEGKDYDMKQMNPGNLFSTPPHCRSDVFMRNNKVPPKSHCVIFQIYQCAVADKYLELSHICGVKFHFKLWNGNWVYGSLAWFTYTHNNLLSLASGIEKGICLICYYLQLLPLHKNVNFEFCLWPKCTKCHSCGSNISQSVLGVIWFLGYTYHYACGEWFIKGNYCTIVEKVCRDLEQKQICQSGGNITTHNILTFTTWISPRISLGSEYASDYEGFFLVKEWILETFANTWLHFLYKFTALWGDHEDGVGEAYLPTIYYTSKVQLVILNNYLTDLFHDQLNVGACVSLDCKLHDTFQYKLLKYKGKVPIIMASRILKLSTWEMWLNDFLEKSYMHLQLYLNFNLEDKVVFKGEGIVMSLPNGAGPNKSEPSLAQERKHQGMSSTYITK